MKHEMYSPQKFLNQSQHSSTLFCSLTIQDTGSLTGIVLAWVERVHEPVDIWDITFCTRRFSVLLKPADFEAQNSLLQNRLHRQIQIPNAFPVDCTKYLYTFSLNAYQELYAYLQTTILSKCT